VDGKKIDVTISVPTIETEVSSASIESISADELQAAFEAHYKPIEVDGKTAVLTSVSTGISSDDRTEVRTEWKVDGIDKIYLRFSPSLENGKLCYLPTETNVKGYTVPTEWKDSGDP
jgi:hypothetical protein